MRSPAVQILLSTYNGEKYLGAQLDSILDQTEKNWQLLIRDDGSTDGTIDILRDYISRIPEKLVLITEGQGGNSSSSFMSLLSHADAPYIMFCDQDDVWSNDKVESGLKELKLLEHKNAVALYFTDMQVVDAELEELHPSFFEQQKLDPSWSQDPYQAFVQSCAAGCSMIFTKALAEQVKPIEVALFQHDHWMLMNASYLGIVGYGTERTVQYRQHGSNVLGAHSVETGYFFSKLATVKQLFSRWTYIKEQFGTDISIWRLLKMKWTINRQRMGLNPVYEKE